MNESIKQTQQRWKDLLSILEKKFGIEPDLQAILFLIGVQELGAGPVEYTRFQKQDLMHIGVCRLMSQQGYYQLNHIDQEGWPHYDYIKSIPKMTLGEQDMLLRELTLMYFEESELI